MKSKISLFVVLVMVLTAVSPVFSAYAEEGIKISDILPVFNPNLEDGKINYAYGQEYVIETNTNYEDGGYNLVNGVIPYEETEGETVIFAGTAKSVTMTLMLDQKYTDIESVNICGVNNMVESGSGNRGFSFDAFKIEISTDGTTFKKCEYQVKSEKWFLFEESSYYNYYFNLKNKATARYVRITMQSSRYMLSINEVQVIGSTNSIYYSDECGNNATFDYYRDGTLKIKGKGAVYDGLFAYATNLKKVVIGEGITDLGSGAFYSCFLLETIELPASLATIGDEAFSLCYSLQSFSVASANTKFSSENGVLFNRLKTELICYPPSKLDAEYTVSDRVRTISNGAFENSVNLQKITLPQTLTTIGDYAFYGSNIIDVTIPHKVSYIGECAFSSCNYLENINVYVNSPYFSSADGVLFDKDQKTLICYPCGKITENYDIPESVVTVGVSAFEGNNYLKKITMGKNVKSIEDYAFYNSLSLESVTIDSGVKTIGDGAFGLCEYLSNVIIKDGVTSIGENAFNGCVSLTSINIPSSVTHIGADAFANIENLVIGCTEGSSAENYAIQNNISYFITSGESIGFTDSKITVKNGIVYGLTDNTTADELSRIMANNHYILTDKNGNVLSGSDVIGTGTIISNGNESYTFVIKGDTDGDGKITSTDYLQIKKAFLRELTFDENSTLAADTNADGNINATDYLQIKSHFLGILNIYA